MKKIAIKITILFGFFAMTAAVSAQVNTLYYMQTVSTRNDLNPAFQSLPNVYVQLPVISGFYFAGGNNSLILHDGIYPKFGNTVTFLHPEYGDKNKLYDQLRKDTRIFSETQVDLLGFGFRLKQKHFITFGISHKSNVSTTLPKDLFKLGLYGTPDTINMNVFDLKKLNVNTNVYTEIALGYSQNVNEQLVLGGKVKFLLGQANVHMKSDKLTLETSRERWIAHMNTEINASAPYMDYYLNDESRIDSVNFNEPGNKWDYPRLVYQNPAGYGGAIDLGASYHILDNHLHLSAAVLDLGYIRWTKNTINAKANGDFEFEGVQIELDEDNNIDLGKLEDAFKGFEDSIKYRATLGNSYGAWIPAKVMLGAEYGILDNRITFGLLSKTIIANQKLYEEVTTSVNFLPINWFNASISYSWMNGRFNNVGLGLGGRIGPVNLYVATDYGPMRYTPEWYPTHTQQVNIKTGLVLNFGYRCIDDEDCDGVKNRKDKCPGTPRGVKVDKHGCPLDSDGDGVPDYLDLCPDTPLGVEVDEHGCPLDSDGDGVPDYLDLCPDTPLGVEVDENGCPFDSDGDGVPDYLDECPDTPQEAWGTVDERGCPKDSDGDGVPDYLDLCPDTPKEAWGMVDEHGCPLDSDGDGVPDYLDLCPDTPLGVKVDEHGCPLMEMQLFEKAMQGIQFETGKATIRTSSYAVLDAIVTAMKDSPYYLLKIDGHTDDVGSAKLNQTLSEKRAASVKDYLVKKGIAENRITTEGFGFTMPKVPNDSAANRAQNRRVEFTIKFEKEVPVGQ